MPIPTCSICNDEDFCPVCDGGLIVCALCGELSDETICVDCNVVNRAYMDNPDADPSQSLALTGEKSLEGDS